MAAQVCGGQKGFDGGWGHRGGSRTEDGRYAEDIIKDCNRRRGKKSGAAGKRDKACMNRVCSWVSEMRECAPFGGPDDSPFGMPKVEKVAMSWKVERRS